MRSFFSICCLLLALGFVIGGFSVLAVDAPEASPDLIKASADGDDLLSDAIKAQVVRRRRIRQIQIVCLFAGAVLFAKYAFTLLRPARKK